MQNEHVKISVSMSEDFEPSVELMEALTHLSQTLADDSADEVTGFQHGLQVGTLKLESAGVESWKNGCWGFSRDMETGEMGCGWYQSDDKSCVGFSGW